LQVVLEATVVLHAGIQFVLSGVAKRRVAEIVCQGDGFHQFLIQIQVTGDGAPDLGDFDAMGQAGAE